MLLPLSVVCAVVLMLLVPTVLIRAYGRLVGDRRQGWALLTVVTILFIGALGAGSAAEHTHHNTVPLAGGAASEAAETRFGIPASALFAVSATASADGAANASYDSFTGPLFVTLVTVFAVTFTALDFVLILALGPLAEGLG